MTTLMKNELIYAYLAGFIDADGSVTIVISRYKEKKTGKLRIQYRIKLSAHNCKIGPIAILQQYFGGGKLRYKKTGKAKLHDNWRPCYEWIICNTLAAEALKKMLPYLTVKKRQAILALRMDKIKKRYGRKIVRRWNPEFGIRCDRVYEKLKQECNRLNKRGM